MRSFQQHSQSLLNERGSSILMVILAVAFGFLIIIGHMQTQADSSLKHLKIAKMHKRDAENFKAELNFILNSNDGCKANFSGVQIQSTNVDDSALSISSLHYGNGTAKGEIFIALDQASKRYGRLGIRKMRLAAHPTKFGIDGVGVHLATLNIQSESSSRDFFSVLPIYVKTDAAGTILSCRSTAYVKKDAAGNELTLEEKLCTDPVPPSQTGNWPADCIECLGGAENYFMCITCKKQGKVYDAAASTCV